MRWLKMLELNPCTHKHNKIIGNMTGWLIVFEWNFIARVFASRQVLCLFPCVVEALEYRFEHRTCSRSYPMAVCLVSTTQYNGITDSARNDEQIKDRVQIFCQKIYSCKQSYWISSPEARFLKEFSKHFG